MKLHMQSRANKWRKFPKDTKFLTKTKCTLENLALSLQLGWTRNSVDEWKWNQVMALTNY